MHGGPIPIYAEGGDVEHPAKTLDHAAPHQGMTGLLKKAGHAKIADPEKHSSMLSDAKKQHEARTNQGEQSKKKNQGHKLGDHLFDKNHDGAADLMHGHPMSGSASKDSIKKVLDRLAPTILANDPHPESMKSSMEYMHSSQQGRNALKSHANGIFDKKHIGAKPNEQSREEIKKFLQETKEDPSKLLDLGGSIGHYMPDHAAQIGAFAATASNYLNALKPMPIQEGPMDQILPPDKMMEEQFNRQIDIAQSPQIAFSHIKSGTIIPQDIETIKTLYPSLYESMAVNLSESLMEAKRQDKEIPYYQRLSLSMFLGQPLDSTMTNESMQAIMKANGLPQQQMQQDHKEARENRATEVEMKAINKADEMAETTLEKRQMNRE